VCKVLVLVWVVEMGERDNRKVTYLTDEEAAQLSEWSDEAGKSESALLRQAVLEYLDHDRAARIEEKVDAMQETLAEVQAQLNPDGAHTHKHDTPMKSTTDSTEKARQIVRRLQSNQDDVMKDDAVTRAIEDIAGIDDRTIRKYKQLFRKRGLLFEHPGETPTWTTESDVWLSWMQDFARLNGKEEADAVAEDYPARIVPNMDGGLRIELMEDP